MDVASESNDVVNDDADRGVVPDDEDDKLPYLTPRYEEVDSDSADEEESDSLRRVLCGIPEVCRCLRDWSRQQNEGVC